VKIARSEGSTAVISKYSSRDIVLKTNCGCHVAARFERDILSGRLKGTGRRGGDGIYKTNHILRSVVAPAGSHVIEFKFDPPIYYLGYTITQVAWGVTLLLILIEYFSIPNARSTAREKAGR